MREATRKNIWSRANNPKLLCTARILTECRGFETTCKGSSCFRCIELSFVVKLAFEVSAVEEALSMNVELEFANRVERI